MFGVVDSQDRSRKPVHGDRATSSQLCHDNQIAMTTPETGEDLPSRYVVRTVLIFFSIDVSWGLAL